MANPWRQKRTRVVGREVPAYLAPQARQEAVVTLKFSEALGCSDDKIRMVLTAPNSAAGTRGKLSLPWSRIDAFGSALWSPG